MSSLTDLLSRVEGATGADRKLDAEIWMIVTPGDYKRVVHPASGLRPRGEDFASWEATWAPRAAPYFTDSLDAALELMERVNAAFCWRVHKQVPSEVETTNGAFWATCGLPGEQEDARGPTPAIALISAMLRALIAAEESR